MKKLIFFAILVMASVFAFAEESTTPNSLKEELVVQMKEAPVNEVVQSIDYLVDKYSTQIATNETTKIITKEAVNNQIVWAKNKLIFTLLSFITFAILSMIFYKLTDKHNNEWYFILTIVTCAFTSISIGIFFICISDWITILHNPHYYAFKELLELIR